MRTDGKPVVVLHSYGPRWGRDGEGPFLGFWIFPWWVFNCSLLKRPPCQSPHSPAWQPWSSSALRASSLWNLFSCFCVLLVMCGDLAVAFGFILKEFWVWTHRTFGPIPLPKILKGFWSISFLSSPYTRNPVLICCLDNVLNLFYFFTFLCPASFIP